MRKVAVLFGLTAMLLMACGGAGASSPEDAVSAFFEAIKSGDAEKASQYVVGGIPEEERAMLSQLGPMMEAMELEVTGSTIEGETAVVTISVSFMGETDTDEVNCIMDGGVWKLEETSF